MPVSDIKKSGRRGEGNQNKLGSHLGLHMGQLYLREEGDCFYRKGSSESETARRTRGIGVCRNLRPTVILTKCEIGDSGSSENFKGHSNYAVERAPVSL